MIEGDGGIVSSEVREGEEVRLTELHLSTRSIISGLRNSTRAESFCGPSREERNGGGDGDEMKQRRI